MTYAQKLKDPRWQAKRLEIMRRDNYTCKYCNSKKEKLHVHHNTYTYGLEPWDYSNNNLVSICADCHMEEEFNRMEFNNLVHDSLAEGLRYDDLYKAIFPLFKEHFFKKEVENG